MKLFCEVRETLYSEIKASGTTQLVNYNNINIILNIINNNGNRAIVAISSVAYDEFRINPNKI